MNFFKQHGFKVALVAFTLAVIRGKNLDINFDLIKNFALGLGLFLIIMSVLVVAHEFGHFLVGKKLGAEPEEFSVGMGKKLYQFKWLGANFCISALPIGGYVKFKKVQFDGENGLGSTNHKIAPSKWIWIALAGPVTNIVLAYIVFFGLIFHGLNTIKVSIVQSSTDSTIQVNDKVISIEGKSSIANVLRKMIARGDESTQGFVLLSDYKTQPVEDLNELKNTIVYSVPETVSFIDKVKYSSTGTIKLLTFFTVSTAKALSGMFTDPAKNYANVSGPIGIGSQLKHTYTLGAEYLWIMFGAISFSLGFMNLLPLSILDGGRVLMAIYQSTISEDINPRFLNILNLASFSGIALLMLAGTIADLIRL